jgi:hypothetical protein
MSRFHALASRPKRTIGVLVTALAAVGVAVGSGANFSAQAANPSNSFTAGTLTMTNNPAGALFSASNLKPGDVNTSTVDIENTGSLSGTFSLSRTNLVDTDGANPLSGKLNVVAKDCGDFSSGPPSCDAGDPNVYSGTLGAMSGSYGLGTFAAGDKHRYQFAITFDGSAGNAYQGDNSTATFQWDAVQ